jgi:hypothetical protein
MPSTFMRACSHVVQIFVARDGTLAERSAFDGFEQRFLTPSFNTRFNQITHARKITLTANAHE